MDKTFSNALEGATVDEAEALAAILEVKLPVSASGFLRRGDIEALWKELSYLGSNDLAYALRGFEGVGYAEIVRDVCGKKKVPNIDKTDSPAGVQWNELALLRTLFEEAWEHMSQEERALLLKNLGLEGGGVNVASSAASAGVLIGELGGFATYQVVLSVANWVARALLGRGLTLVGNAMLARALGVILGPVGWVASGGWLLLDIASPAARKTVPAVIQIAALRQLTHQREVIGVMGHGSTGKDSLLKSVFDIDTKNVSPIPGSTSSAATFAVPGTTPLRVVNFPGFGDLRPEVNDEIHQHAPACTSIIYLFNGAEIPKADELAEWERHARVVGRTGLVDVIPVLNKWDKADEDEQDSILANAKSRLGRDDIIVASMKKGRPFYESGRRAIRKRLNELALARGHGAPFPNEEPRTTDTLRLVP